MQHVAVTQLSSEMAPVTFLKLARDLYFELCFCYREILKCSLAHLLGIS